MKTNLLLCGFLALSSVQAGFAAATPDKKMVSVIGPVKTVVTEIEEIIPDTLYLQLPYATHELAMDGVVYQAGDTLYNAVSFDKNGNFSHCAYLLEAPAELDFSKHNPTENVFIEKGDFTGTDEPFDAYRLRLVRGSDNEILELSGEISYGWNDTKRLSYGYGGYPLSYTYVSASDGYADFCAVYSKGWLENAKTIVVDDEYSLSEYLKTMVVSQHLSAQDFVPLTVSVVDYSDYEFDKYGNWISRKATAKTFETEAPFINHPSYGGGDEDEEDEQVEKEEAAASEPLVTSWIERRTITYYE